jgi:hypothetical protein
MSKLTEDIEKYKPNLKFHKVELKSMKEVAKLMGIDFDKIKCSRNGIKKDGESCRKNNKCTYPNCLK